MIHRKQCPDCGSYDTEPVYREWDTDLLEETRICNDCSVQFTNEWDLYDQTIDEVPMNKDSA